MTGEGEGGAKVFKLRMNGRKKITVSKTWNVRSQIKYWKKKKGKDRIIFLNPEIPFGHPFGNVL